MAVTVISYPLGHKLASTLYSAEIVDSGGDALVVHSETVIDGSHVYIDSNIDRYNGFKFVVEVSPTTFKIRDEIGGDEIEFIQEQDITFQISVLEHSWQSVHLPIVYKLASNLFPTNSVDPERTVLSFTNLNGYTYLTVSDSIGSVTSFEALDFVKISGAASSEVNGVFQIIYRNAGDIFSIDLAYNASYNFTGATVQLYKSNYFITLGVYSGLESGHRWDVQDPSKLTAIFRLIPDANNQIQFSISEVLKGKINTRNNLTLDTLPNNLDFYTQFHMVWYESYDVADDGEIVVFESATVIDSFIGNAVNSMMPFKSLNESFMSDYIDADDYPSRWLTLLDRPVAVVGYFFDLSFLLRHDGDVNVVIFKSYNGTVTSTEIIELIDPGTGVIRVPIIPESGYDLYCVSVSTPSSGGGYTPPPMDDFLTWSNVAAPSRPSWAVVGSEVQVNTDSLGTGVTSEFWATTYTLQAGITYTFGYTFSSGSATGIFRIVFLNSSNSILVTSGFITVTGSTTVSGSASLLAVTGCAKIAIYVFQNASCGGVNCLHSIEAFTNDTPITPETPGDVVVEQICIDIISECGDTFTNDNLRITETELFRELE